jgi:predicted metal-binding membrane protein
MTQAATPLEAVLKRDRAIVFTGLAAVAALAWAYLAYRAWDMQQRMSAGAMGMGMDAAMYQFRPWGLVDFVTTFIMWAVMMVAMMVPTAAPMILTFATVNRRRRERQQPFVPTGVFLSGYLMVWFGFSVAATMLQWGLHQGALLRGMMGSAVPLLGGVILVAAGVFQWTPLKYVCLNHCRTPLGFIMTEWREGPKGALVMGARHGGFCLGCCWFLMGLLFVAGVMNLLWIAVIAAYVLVEKVVPAGHWLGRMTGLALIGWGAWIVAGALV